MMKPGLMLGLSFLLSMPCLGQIPEPFVGTWVIDPDASAEVINAAELSAEQKENWLNRVRNARSQCLTIDITGGVQIRYDNGDVI